MFLCKKKNKWNNKKKDYFSFYHFLKQYILFVLLCKILLFIWSSVTAAAFKWYLVFSIGACSNLNVTKIDFD